MVQPSIMSLAAESLRGMRGVCFVENGRYKPNAVTDQGRSTGR
jgi:hypothetical protein